MNKCKLLRAIIISSIAIAPNLIYAQAKVGSLFGYQIGKKYEGTDPKVRFDQITQTLIVSAEKPQLATPLQYLDLYVTPVSGTILGIHGIAEFAKESDAITASKTLVNIIEKLVSVDCVKKQRQSGQDTVFQCGRDFEISLSDAALYDSKGTFYIGVNMHPVAGSVLNKKLDALNKVEYKKVREKK
jgi:hypothetical protein